MDIEFTKDEKVEMFNRIASYYYKHNFGNVSKSEMELLMFHFYLEKIMQDSTDEDGTIDYRRCSDYRMSKDLGITQQRIRNLRIKEKLVFVEKESEEGAHGWEKEFAKLMDSARLDGKKIIISIPDPNLYIEIENYIEENGGYIEKQINGKLMQIRIEYFVELCLLAEDEKSRKRIIKELKKRCKKENSDEKAFDENNLAKSLMYVFVNTTTLLANVSGLFSQGNYIGMALEEFISRMV